MGIIRRIANAARAGIRAFGHDMAGGSGRWPREAQLWAPTRQGLAARAIMSARAGYLGDNSPTGRSAVDQWTEALIADGPSARSGHPDAGMRVAIEAAWLRFAADPDIEGAGADLAEFLRRVARTVVTAGEGFVRLLIVEGRLKLQLLTTEQVDASINRELPNGGRIIAGIEVDANGTRVAYWIRPQAADLWLAMISPPVRIDAADICHVLDPRHAGAIRGLSWLGPVGTRLVELDRLEDSLLARMRVAALFAGFVHDSEGSSGFGGADGGTRDPQEMSAEPGTIRVLPSGCTIDFSDVPDTAGAPEFLRHMVRSVACGIGIPYELLAADLSTVNYSSAKLGLEAFRRRVKSLQASMIGSRLLIPVWKRLVATEIAAGRLRAPGFVRDAEAFFAVTFLWPAWASLDPLKDAEADQVALANRTKSREQVIAERGRDIADVDQEIARDPVPPPAIRPLAPANPVRA
jgi:lambda family phage portal protein